MNEILQSPISTIGSYGLLGALLIVAGWVIWNLSNRLAKVQEDRLAEVKEVADVLNAHSVVLANWTSSNDARTRALEASVRSQELASVAHAALLQDVKSNGAGIAEMSREVQQLRNTLMQRGLAG